MELPAVTGATVALVVFSDGADVSVVENNAGGPQFTRNRNS